MFASFSWRETCLHPRFRDRNYDDRLHVVSALLQGTIPDCSALASTGE
jgi:hypothetical protein